MKTWKDRIADDEIYSLPPGGIFVFGSNESGRHGKGAAKTALKKFGAIWGQAAGLQGRSYGIPTKDKAIKRVLSVVEIKKYVDDFIAFAKERTDLTFHVTAIGTGLSKLSHKDIAPLFVEAVELENVHLPSKFWHKLI